MERLTTYHAGKAVIKDKSRLSEAMEKLARYEDWEENEHRIFRALPVKDEIGLINGDYLIVSDTIQEDDVIEKTVFLTFEDAKKAVEKLKNTQGIEVNDYVD